MENVINCQNFYATGASDTSITIGVGAPNTIVAPELLRVNATGAFTIFLPPINTILANPPRTTQATTGIDGCFEMAITNAGGATITITPNGNDSILPNPIIFPTSVGAVVRIRSNSVDATWYQVN